MATLACGAQGLLLFIMDVVNEIQAVKYHKKVAI